MELSVIYKGEFMSGDVGLDDQSIVFYTRQMTESKKVLLKHKGIALAYSERNALVIENENLKAQVKFLQQQLEYKTFGKPKYD